MDPTWEDVWVREVESRLTDRSAEAILRAHFELEVLFVAKRLHADDFGGISGACRALEEELDVMLPDELEEAVDTRNAFSHAGPKPTWASVERAVSCYRTVIRLLYEAGDGPRPSDEGHKRAREQLRRGIGKKKLSKVRTRWEQYRDLHPERAILSGKVRKLKDRSAIIGLEHGVWGHVDVAEIAHGRVNRPSEKLREGQEVRVRILEYVESASRIILSIRQALPDPWIEIEALRVSKAIVQGVVGRGSAEGLQVEVLGILGIVEYENMSLKERPIFEDIPAEGSRVDVIVQAVMPAYNQLYLSIRHAQWRRFCEHYPVGTVVTAPVAGLWESGLRIQLDFGMTLEVPSVETSWLGRPAIHTSFRIGQEISVLITAGSDGSGSGPPRSGFRALKGSIRLCSPPPEVTHPLGGFLHVRVTSIQDGACVQAVTPDGVDTRIPWRELVFPNSWNEPNAKLVGTQLATRIIGHEREERRLLLSERRAAGRPDIPPDVEAISTEERLRREHARRQADLAARSEAQEARIAATDGARRKAARFGDILIAGSVPLGASLYAMVPELGADYTGSLPFPVFWFGAVIASAGLGSMLIVDSEVFHAHNSPSRRTAFRLVLVANVFIWGALSYAARVDIGQWLGTQAEELDRSADDSLRWVNQVSTTGHGMSLVTMAKGGLVLLVLVPISRAAAFICEINRQLCQMGLPTMSLIVPWGMIAVLGRLRRNEDDDARPPG